MTADLENVGTATGEIELIIDGGTIEVYEVGADETRQIEETHRFDEEGDHTVALGDESVEVSVEDDDDMLLWILPLVAVVVIVLVVLFMKRKKDEDEEEEEEEEMSFDDLTAQQAPPPSAREETRACPDCRQELSYIEEY